MGLLLGTDLGFQVLDLTQSRDLTVREGQHRWRIQPHQVSHVTHQYDKGKHHHREAVAHKELVFTPAGTFHLWRAESRFSPDDSCSLSARSDCQTCIEPVAEQGMPGHLWEASCHHRWTMASNTGKTDTTSFNCLFWGQIDPKIVYEEWSTNLFINGCVTIHTHTVHVCDTLPTCFQHQLHAGALFKGKVYSLTEQPNL